jgi:hypothetical protein
MEMEKAFSGTCHIFHVEKVCTTGPRAQLYIYLLTFTFTSSV